MEAEKVKDAKIFRSAPAWGTPPLPELMEVFYTIYCARNH
jgi:hypothetical protein